MTAYIWASIVLNLIVFGVNLAKPTSKKDDVAGAASSLFALTISLSFAVWGIYLIATKG